MKYLFSLVFLLSCLSSFAQEPAYTPMRLNYQFRGIKVDSLFLIPSFNDTTAANSSTMKNVAGAMIRTGNDFWMRNATTNAWLQNVNVGTGASPSIQFVDSVWRVLGKDSIFWRKGGTTNKIKDSIGVSGSGTANTYPKFTSSTVIGNSKLSDNNLSTLTFDGTANPNGTSFILNSANGQGAVVTFKENADDKYFIGMDASENFSIFSYITSGIALKVPANSTRVLINDPVDDTSNALQVNGNARISGLSATTNRIVLSNTLGKLYNDSILTIVGDTITTNGQIKFQAADGTVIKAGDFTDANKIGNVLYNRASDNANTSGGDFHAYIPGVFKMNDASSSNDFLLPDPTLFPGQMCIVINKDATDATGLAVENSGGVIYDKGTATQITSLPATEMGTFFSDGANWYGFIL